MEKYPLRILVTGAAGQLGYALLPMIAQGMMLGPDQPIILHILGSNADSLKGIKMELDDSIFPLLKDVVATTDTVEACQGINIAILAGGAPMKEGMRRKDLLPMNASLYKAKASALDKHAAPNCKVLMVANPANTNALVLKEFAPSIPAKHITCLTRLDHNRALGLIAEKLNVPFSDVKNVIVWGNHSPSQYPDTSFATVSTDNGEKPVKDLVDEQWLQTEYITAVQHRGDALIKTRKKNSAFSAAKATCDHIRDWFLGTHEGEWVSMGVCSDGSYGIEPGLMYSFPVTCQKGEWSIVQGLEIDEFSRKMMEATEKELIEERDWAYSCLEEYESCEE